jgi:hypothetical protein
LFSARSLIDSHSTDTGQNAHTIPLQFLPDHKAERWINRRQHRLATAKQGDVKPSLPEGIRHLQPDIARANEHRPFGLTFGQAPVNRKTVLDRMKQEDPVERAPWKIRAYWRRPGCDDQAVIADDLFPCRVLDRDGFARGVNRFGCVLPQDVDAWKLSAMGEIAPIRRLPAKVIRQPTDAEIREVVCDRDCHLGAGVEFVSAQSGADSGVAAADDEKMHDDPWRIDAILETTVSLRFKALTKRPRP